MLVGNRMAQPVITVHPDLPIQEAIDLMRKEHIRRLPVINEHGRLLGIVSESDLLNASPSDATSLNVWEINYLMSKINVGKVMTTNLITVTEDTPIEEAARIMADHKIGGLPVMRDGELVGIITETNLFRIFLELLGAREKGVRLTAVMKNQMGALSRLTECIQKLGGNIIALGTFMGESASTSKVVVKVKDVTPEALKAEVAPIVEKIEDIRYCC